MDSSEDGTAERRLDLLLALVTDAEACAKRRAELKDAQAALQGEKDGLDEVRQAAEAAKADAVQTLEAAQQLRNEAAAIAHEYAVKHEALGARITEHEENEKAYLQRESDLKVWAGKVGEQDTALSHREAAVEKREADAQAAQDAADAMKADYESRIVKIVDHATGKA